MSKDQVKQLIHVLIAVVDDVPYIKSHPLVAAIWNGLKGTLLSDAVIDAVWAQFVQQQPVTPPPQVDPPVQ